MSLSFPLFVPADRSDRLDKAAMFGPDVVLADLEDAVSRDAKQAARDALARWLSGRRADVAVCIRINCETDPEHAADLDLCGKAGVSAVMLPKAATAASVARVKARTGLPVIALIENARGLARVEEIAEEAAQLAFGSIDFAADLGLQHTPLALHHARSRIVLASRLAGIAAPLDGVTTAVRDVDQLQRDCAHAVEMGFGGKLLIHPDQLAPARAAFAPDAAAIGWAERVLAAEGSGAVLIDGEMVDAPVIARARQILHRSGRTPA